MHPDLVAHPCTRYSIITISLFVSLSSWAGSDDSRFNLKISQFKKYEYVILLKKNYTSR